MSILDESIAAVARLTALLHEAQEALAARKTRATKVRQPTGRPVGRPRGVKHPPHDPERAPRPPGRPRLLPPKGTPEFAAEMSRRRRAAYEKRKLELDSSSD